MAQTTFGGGQTNMVQNPSNGKAKEAVFKLVKQIQEIKFDFPLFEIPSGLIFYCVPC